MPDIPSVETLIAQGRLLVRRVRDRATHSPFRHPEDRRELLNVLGDVEACIEQLASSRRVELEEAERAAAARLAVVEEPLRILAAARVDVAVTLDQEALQRWIVEVSDRLSIAPPEPKISAVDP